MKTDTKERIKISVGRVYSKEYSERLWQNLEKVRAKLEGIDLYQIVAQDRSR